MDMVTHVSNPKIQEDCEFKSSLEYKARLHFKHCPPTNQTKQLCFRLSGVVFTEILNPRHTQIKTHK